MGFTPENDSLRLGDGVGNPTRVRRVQKKGETIKEYEQIVRLGVGFWVLLQIKILSDLELDL